jgi:CRP/FNR family transcriptional regulator, cyclic AMP receptor protein
MRWRSSGGTTRLSASPTSTAIAEVATSANADPRKTDSLDAPELANESVASWVLSPELSDEDRQEGRAHQFPVHDAHLWQFSRQRSRAVHPRNSALCSSARAPMISTVEKVLFLKSIDLFSQIPGEDLTAVALISSEERRDPGDEIFAEGESGDALYLVIDGKVRVHKQDRVIAELGERECFGEMAILDAAPRSATVTALNETAMLKITREDFQEIMTEKPEIAMGIVKVLTRRLRDAIR